MLLSSPLLLSVISKQVSAMENQKKTRGRQKLEIKKIEKTSRRHITFSKRRFGIYKKANELVALTGAEILFGVLSPSGKAYTFGHPSIEAVANCFLGQDFASDDFTQSSVDTSQCSRIQELTQRYNDAADHLDLEKQRGKELQRKLKGKHGPGWWSAEIEELDMEQLLQLRTNLKAAENKLWESLAKSGGASTSNPIVPHP